MDFLPYPGLVFFNFVDSLVDCACCIDNDFAVIQCHRRSWIVVGYCHERAVRVLHGIHIPDVGRNLRVGKGSVDCRRNFLVHLFRQRYPLVSP